MPQLTLNEAVQNMLAQNPGTRTDWAPVIALPADSEERMQSALAVYNRKVLAQKPSDFNFHKRFFSEEQLSHEDLEQFESRMAMVNNIIEQLAETNGNLHVTHLQALAQKNLANYHDLTRRMVDAYWGLDPDVFDGDLDNADTEILDKKVLQHIFEGPSVIVSTEPPSAPPSTPPSPAP